MRENPSKIRWQRKNRRRHAFCKFHFIPQVAEKNPPQPKDAAGEDLLYDGCTVDIFPESKY